jgi:hypothetical protein
MIWLANIDANQLTILGYNVRSTAPQHPRKNANLLAVVEFPLNKQHQTWMRYQLSKQFAIDMTLSQWHKFEPKWQQYSINCFLGSTEFYRNIYNSWASSTNGKSKVVHKALPSTLGIYLCFVFLP